MFNPYIVSPLVGLLALIDVLIHINLDIKKAKRSGRGAFREPNEEIPQIALVVVTIATLFAFFLVMLISVSWLIGTDWTFVMLLLIPNPPVVVWISGIILLIGGILLHLWARAIRGAMASSWIMSKDHQLITVGPYSRIRHPSYLSYCLSFMGMFLMIPSLGTALLLLGVIGYYHIAVVEERVLLHHFGVEYRKYMDKTGRFVPPLKKD